MKTIVGYTLSPWRGSAAQLRLSAPWGAAGIQLIEGTHWDQVDLDPIRSAGLVYIHRDFPRLAGSYAQVVESARAARIPIVYDYDEDLFNMPRAHPDRQYLYQSDALFPMLQAAVEADAVTVSTPSLLEVIQPLNANTRLLPTCLDDRLWEFTPFIDGERSLFTIGWINDQPKAPEAFTSGVISFLHAHKENSLLRVWGGKPPEALLSLPNVDWLTDLPNDYQEYSRALYQMGFDLVVVPQVDHPFYHSQSPLRFFEISACGIPGVFSRQDPYSEVVVHQQNGWLAETAEQWEQALELLHQPGAARRQLALKAQESVRKDWLLSNRAGAWSALYEDLTSREIQPDRPRRFAEQAAAIASQVRDWQRALEQRIRDRDWEVRALNVMMKQKERESGEYIDQLNAQMAAVWNSPTYRLLDKVRHPGKLFSRAGGSHTGSPIPAGPVQHNEPVQADALSALPPAHSYDILLFSSSGGEEDSAWVTQFTKSLRQQGSRVFIILPQSSSRAGVIPTEAGNVRVHISGDGEDSFHALEQLRLDAGIEDAVCWVDDSAWYNLAFRLRNRFGWKIAAAHPGGETNLSDDNLHQRSDVILDQREPGAQISALMTAIPRLYPLASLVVLTYNNLNYTRQCLESIYTKTSYPNIQLVVVDNASSDGTPEFLRTFAQAHPSVKLVLNQENRGFSAGNNQGVQASSGETLVFLNNDIVVTQGWLSRLIQHLRDPQVGAVGPVTNYSGNESRIPVEYSDLSGLDDFARRYARDHDGRSFEIRMLALFCMALRRSTIERVGLLDERFNVGMYEDDDFSLRMRQMGYRILCAEDVYIHHWGSASFSQLAAERYQRLHVENRQKFEEKWGTHWQPHRQRMIES